LLFPQKRENVILPRFWIPVFTGMTGCVMGSIYAKVWLKIGQFENT